jgi:hypothetical protein
MFSLIPACIGRGGSNAYISPPAAILYPLNAELNPIRHLLALVGARHIVHVSRAMVNILPNSLFTNHITLRHYVEIRTE